MVRCGEWEPGDVVPPNCHWKASLHLTRVAPPALAHPITLPLRTDADERAIDGVGLAVLVVHGDRAIGVDAVCAVGGIREAVGASRTSF
jgi:hypothetical protein